MALPIVSCPDPMNGRSAQNGKAPRKVTTFSFAWLLTAVLLLFLLIGLSLIAIVYSYFTRKSVEELANRIVVQTLARVELRTNALLDAARRQNEQGKLLMEGGQLPTRDFKLLGGYLSHSLTI